MSLLVCYRKDKVTHFLNDSGHAAGQSKIILSEKFNINVWIPKDDPEAIIAATGPIRDRQVLRNIEKLTKNYSKEIRHFNMEYMYNRAIPMIQKALYHNRFVNPDEPYSSDTQLFISKKNHTYFINQKAACFEFDGISGLGDVSVDVCALVDKSKEPLPALLQAVLEIKNSVVNIEFPLIYINSRDREFIRIDEAEARKIIKESEGK